MSELSDAIESLVDSKIEKASRGGTQTVVATYQGRDGEGKPWVLLPGADSPTPVGRVAVECSAGDSVSVTIGNGIASIDANLTDRSAGMNSVKATRETAEKAIDYASQASVAAGAAQQSAKSATASAQTANDAASQAISDAASAATAASSAQSSATAAATAASVADGKAVAAGQAAQAAQNSLKSVVQGATTVEKAVSVMQTALEAVVDYDPDNDDVQEWFWHDANGAHVLGDTSGYRNDIDSSGMDIKQVSTEASVARFGADESRIGESSKIAASIKSNGFSLRSDEGNGGKPFFSVTMPHSPVNPKAAWFKVLTSATQFPVEIPLTYTDDQLETHSIDSVYDMYGIFVSGSDSIPTITQDTVLEIDAPCDLIGNGGSLPDYVVTYDAANHKITVDNTGELAAILSEYAYAAITGIIADGTAYEQPRMLFDVDSAGSLYADYRSLQLIDREGGTYFHVSDLRGADGMLQVVDTFIGDGSNRRFQTTLGIDVVVSVKLNGMTTRQYTVVDGTAIYFDTAPGSNVTIEVTYKTTDSNAKAFTFGDRGQGNVGALSVVEGGNCIASGLVAHAEGIHTEASGWSAHAEGDSTVASGLASHAENYETTASGYASHAEGLGTTASGDNGSHAEGLGATASGDCSHAQNLGTKAASNNQTAIGKYNVEDANDTYALIIGNGAAGAPSDALEVDWNGNVLIDGDVQDLSGSKLYADASHSHAYLPLSGGKLTGQLKFNDSTALPNASTSTDFFATGINAFANGGRLAYKGLADFRTWLGLAALAYKASLAAGDIPNLDAGKITSGTFAAARIPTLDQTKITPIYYQAHGSGNLSLTAGTITKVTLVTTGARSSGSGLAISSGGIKITTAGRYRVTAGAYVSVTGSSASAMGVYVKYATDSGAYPAASEVLAAVDHFSGANAGAVFAGPKIFQCAANSILYLAARAVGGAGTCDQDNESTYLLVERLS